MSGLNKDKRLIKRPTVKRLNKKRAVIALLLATVGLVVFALASAHTYQEKQKVQLNKTLQEKVQLQKELEQNKLDSQENQKQIEQLKKDLQAKRDGQARALAESARVTPVQAPRAYSGSHADWMSAAGIPSDQWAATEALVQRESSWNPNAYNSIGACSLVQALPCSKIPGDWRDPVTALRWGNGYVVARYGSWNNALAHSYAFNWY